MCSEVRVAIAVAMGLDAKPMDEVLNQAACCKSIKRQRIGLCDSSPVGRRGAHQWLF